MTSAAERARRWLAADPDPETRAETELLLAGDPAVLQDRFGRRLQFGTAGLRGAIGAGPNRMSRLLVRQAAAGLGRYVLSVEVAEPLVVVGFDARRKSDVFALDTARVLAAQGVRVALLPCPLPTPVLAYATMTLGATAGVMVTASHNPPADNGYKVFLGDGAQIVSPIDAVIARHIDNVDPAALPLAEPDEERIVYLDSTLIDAYVAMVAGVRLVPDLHCTLRVAYTPLHGVGRDTLLAAFAAADLPAPIVVSSQSEPDPTFPTVAFPNPEEPGALDALLDTATSCGAALALANDPDADRLGVAIPMAEGGWRALRGDEIGWLLADHVLRHTSGNDRLVVTTLVSSSLLAKMAKDYGVHYAETFTGFKWIASARRDRPGQRFVFGYEQALGYLVTDKPHDKDGISAAILMVEIAELAARDGVSIESRLTALGERYGVHRIAERSIPIDATEGVRRVAMLRGSAPAAVAGLAVTEVTDFPEANLLRFQCGPLARVQIRPSGTESKVKIYAETIGTDPVVLADALATLFVGL